MPNFHLLFDDPTLKTAVKIAAALDNKTMGEWIVDAVERKMIHYVNKDRRIADTWRPKLEEKKVASA